MVIPLNNLASLLWDTNRFTEAETLMNHALEISVNFTRTNGHPHPELQAILDNYANLLTQMGRSGEQIIATLHGIAPELFEH
jgi:hypothetical protein